MAALFLILICLPGIFGLLGYSNLGGFTENRVLATFPKEELRHLDYRGFSRKFDSFISDHFGFRSSLIYAVSWAKMSIGAPSKSSVIIGKNGWLYNDAGTWDYDEYRGIVSPDAKAIEQWRTVLKARKKAVEKYGSYFVMVAAPDKATIYSEFLPNWLQPQGHQTRMRQFFEAMKGSGVDMLDLTSDVLAAKNEGRLYYRGDTHWNSLGAFWGAKGIIDYLQKRFANLPPFRADDYTTTSSLVTTKPDGGGLDLLIRQALPYRAEEDFVLEKKGGWTTKETITHRGHVDIYTYTKNDPSLPTLLVYTDSYGFYLYRVLAEHFRRAIFINWWPKNNHLIDSFPLDIIKQEKPDIFINFRFERGILDSINTAIE